MKTFTADQLKTLETRKAELEKCIEELCERIIANHNALAEKIFDTKNEIMHFETFGANGVETDIYDVQSILEAGKHESIDDYKKNLKLLYKAYSACPYSDKRVAEEILQLLEEYEQVVAEFDLYHSDQIKKAQEELNKAQKKLKQMVCNRDDYRRSVHKVAGVLKKTALDDVIGWNELYKHGANRITSNVLFGLPSVSMNGAEIVDICKKAVETEKSNAEKNRVVQPRPRDRIVRGENAMFVEGEPTAFFGSGILRGFSKVFK